MVESGMMNTAHGFLFLHCHYYTSTACSQLVKKIKLFLCALNVSTDSTGSWGTVCVSGQ